jgi:hypothetical protein
MRLTMGLVTGVLFTAGTELFSTVPPVWYKEKSPGKNLQRLLFFKRFTLYAYGETIKNYRSAILLLSDPFLSISSLAQIPTTSKLSGIITSEFRTVSNHQRLKLKRVLIPKLPSILAPYCRRMLDVISRLTGLKFL